MSLMSRSTIPQPTSAVSSTATVSSTADDTAIETVSSTSSSYALQQNVAVNAPLVHVESSGSSLMPPPVMSMELPPTQYPTKTVPSSMNYMKFNFQMQMH